MSQPKVKEIYFNPISARKVATLAEEIPSHISTARNYLAQANAGATPFQVDSADRNALEHLNRALAKAKQVVADLEVMIAKGNS